MIRTSIAAAALVLLTTIRPAFAGQHENAAPSAAGAPLPQHDAANNRLMIVNGNTGRIIYDDGRDDLFCVTRRYFVGWYYDGRRMYRRTMSCR
jgi:hypothetical protein